ncbi:MAG TPA: YcaO-like family protein, partial [Spirochaetota bacterium]|nr:YcaO-like family protein [Spirochaetota bacterium]
YLTDLKNNAEYIYPYLNTALKVKPQNEEASYIEVKDIVTNKNILFPIRLLFQSSNGYTAGNEEKEALVHGIFEIVERYTQTLFVIKQSDATKNDILSRSHKQLYSYDVDLFNDLNKFDPFIVSVDSIIKEFPDLEKVINSIAKNFDKFEIVDISLDINGVRFYSYIIRQSKDEVNFKLFSSGGCHFDQRIALLRAITEASQGYVPYEKLNQSWNGYLFTRNFINKVFDSKLDIKPLVKDKRVFNSMDDIYTECVKPFKSIMVFDCTNDKFNIPVYSLYIPELYSKSFLWSNIFCTSQVGDVDLIKALGENNIIRVYKFLTEKSISGVESLFFLENHNQLNDTLREAMYNLYISYTNDKELFNFILDNEENDSFKKELKELFENQNTPEISTIPSIDSYDEESFLYFNKILTKQNKDEDDFLYLIESYCKMGQLDYAIYFAEKNGFEIDEITNEY